MNWREKVVFITGAASGIGRHLALELAGYDANLALMDVDVDGLNDLKEELPSGTECLLLQGDVTDPSDVERCFESTATELGSPNVVLANAGLGYSTSAVNYDDADFKRLLAVNYEGVVNTLSEGLDRMLEKEEPGQLVITSSVAAFLTGKGGAAYCGSKAGVLRLAESLRFDLRDDPISVTTLHPGWVRTPLTEKYPEGMRSFEISPEVAAVKIREAIENDSNQVIFPWQTRLLVYFMSIAPEFILDFVKERLPLPEEIQ